MKNKKPSILFPWKNIKKTTPEEDKAFQEQLDREKLGLKDGFAMTVAAFLTLFLPAALILIGCCLLVMLLFGAFN
ncbi:MAG: hypothetical protein J6B86_06245 [Clostridia bacterium]|nr:hypothetical protein [Clostridia bacterium]